MENKQIFSCKQLLKKVWEITAPLGEQMYLVEGRSHAMLIDTGMGIGDLKAVVESITNLPVIVVNTHGHPDHAGGNSWFKEAWIHPDDKKVYEEMCSNEYRRSDVIKICGPKDAPEYIEHMNPFGICLMKPLYDHQIFDLGGRKLQVLFIPGHTKGSIALLDTENKIVFSGDSISNSDIWLYLEHSESLQTYYNSMKMLKQFCTPDMIFCPGHLPVPVGIEAINSLILCAERILMRDSKGIEFITFAGSGLRYETNNYSIIYNPDKVYSV